MTGCNDNKESYKNNKISQKKGGWFWNQDGCQFGRELRNFVRATNENESSHQNVYKWNSWNQDENFTGVSC